MKLKATSERGDKDNLKRGNNMTELKVVAHRISILDLNRMKSDI